MEKRTLVVNFFSGPGVGKSTMAAGVFYELKMAGIECELALEYAKDKVWEQSYAVLDNQLYITSKQYHRLKILNRKVQVIITDSPLLLGLYYGKKDREEFKNLVISLHNEFESLNIFLERIYDYNLNGRIQTEEEAKEIDNEITSITDKYIGDIEKIQPTRESVKKIVDLIKFKLNES
jgi:hypothetical protein